MTTSTSNVSASRRANAAPPLENGDHLDQPTFHARYLTMPKSFRAELIGGIVHAPSPLKIPHGDVHGQLMMWLNLYRAQTPGTCALDNATDILGPDSEPQPDGCLIIEGDDGVLRSARFPGLWLDSGALFRGDTKRVIEIVNAGIASAEHAAFVASRG